MANYAGMFTNKSFKATISSYCNQIGWKIEHIEENLAVLVFQMESGQTQTLFVVRHESTLEFSVPSEASFASFEEIPDTLSSILMQRNRVRRYGFWCIMEIENRYVFTVMHNAEMSLLSIEYFAIIVQALLEECDQFERALKQMFEETGTDTEEPFDWDLLLKSGLAFLLGALMGSDSDIS